MKQALGLLVTLTRVILLTSVAANTYSIKSTESLKLSHQRKRKLSCCFSPSDRGLYKAYDGHWKPNFILMFTSNIAWL